MADRKAQIETLWTYEISKEKVLKRLMKKDSWLKRKQTSLLKSYLNNWTLARSLVFAYPHSKKKMRANGSCPNLYISITEIAKEKKTSSSSYLIQSWVQSNTTVEYLRMWEKTYSPKFQEDACDELIHMVYSTGTFTVDQHHPRHGNEDISVQGRWNDRTS